MFNNRFEKVSVCLFLIVGLALTCYTACSDTQMAKKYVHPTEEYVDNTFERGVEIETKGQERVINVVQAAAHGIQETIRNFFTKDLQEAIAAQTETIDRLETQVLQAKADAVAAQEAVTKAQQAATTAYTDLAKQIADQGFDLKDLQTPEGIASGLLALFGIGGLTYRKIRKDEEDLKKKLEDEKAAPSRLDPKFRVLLNLIGEKDPEVKKAIDQGLL